MNNPRRKAELAAFLGCKPEEIISCSLTPEVKKHRCSECRFYKGGIKGASCDIGDGQPVALAANYYACKLYKRAEPRRI